LGCLFVILGGVSSKGTLNANDTRTRLVNVGVASLCLPRRRDKRGEGGASRSAGIVASGTKATPAKVSRLCRGYSGRAN
jgi:hypothetical protein